MLAYGAWANSAESQPSSAGVLTLDHCLLQLEESHPDLAAAAQRVESARTRVDVTLERFIPQIKVDIGASEQRRPLAGPYYSYFHREKALRTRSALAGIGVVGDLPWGMDFELGLDARVSSYSSYVEALNPVYEPGLRLRLSQRLLQGVGPSVNLAPLDIAKLAVSEEEAEAIATLDALALDASLRWLDAVRQEANLTLQKESLDLAKRFLALTEERIEAGKLSRLDLAVAVQTVANREAIYEHFVAERTASRGLLVSTLGLEVGADTATLDALRLPELGSWVQGEPPVVDALPMALTHSPRIKALLQRRESLEVEARSAEDAALPDVRVFAESRLSGLAGTSTCVDGYLSDALTPCGVPPEYSGGLDRALSNVAGGQLYDVRVGVGGTIPTFFGPALARPDSIRQQMASLELQAEAERRRITWRVRQLTRDVASRERLLERTRQAVISSTDALEAEDQKLEAGRSTAYALLQAQESLLAARAQHVAALHDLARSRIELLGLTGRLRSRSSEGAGPSPAASDGVVPSPAASDGGADR